MHLAYRHVDKMESQGKSAVISSCKWRATSRESDDKKVTVVGEERFGSKRLMSEQINNQLGTQNFDLVHSAVLLLRNSIAPCLAPACKALPACHTVPQYPLLI